jgi:hypothetical protein
VTDINRVIEAKSSEKYENKSLGKVMGNGERHPTYSLQDKREREMDTNTFG